jgi:3-dehydroquinate synthase
VSEIALEIQSHRGKYPVHFGSIFDGLGNGLRENEHLIIDANVARLYAKPLASALASGRVVIIEATEANKSLEHIPFIIGQLLGNGCKRGQTLVAVGGGIIQDITAFLAATLFRGMDWKLYPTTLLAQADSCIGSKSSINVAGYKNQIGTFTPPTEIRISAEVLKTLEAKEMHSGVGEMIKVHMISSPEDITALGADYPRLFSDPAILKNRILRSLKIKQAFIERDEFDQGDRLLLNYGHSFGHAIETATEYAIPHGIAVTLGMDIANYVSMKMGLLESSAYHSLRPLLLANSRPFERVEIPLAAFFAALAKDKKNTDANLNLVLSKGPGAIFRQKVALTPEFRGWCEEYFLKNRSEKH